jgi:hypothetical protein
MKTITNEKLIYNRRRIGQVATFVSLGILGIGLYMSFKPELMSYSFAALIVGFLLSQLGIYYGGRWGRSPRPDEVISQALKGLDNKYTLYHYISAVNHLLVGPAGIWILMPFHQGGTITYDKSKGRWKQKGGNMYLKIFAQESLGRPDMDAKTQSSAIQKFIDNKLPEIDLVKPQTILIFSNEKAEISISDSPIPTLTVDKLKDFIRRTAKQDPVPSEMTQPLIDVLPTESIEQRNK